VYLTEKVEKIKDLGDLEVTAAATACMENMTQGGIFI